MKPQSLQLPCLACSRQGRYDQWQCKTLVLRMPHAAAAAAAVSLSSKVVVHLLDCGPCCTTTF